MTPISPMSVRSSDAKAPEAPVSTWSAQELVQSFIKDLHPRTKEIVIKRFGLDGDKPRTLEQIGKSYGVTRERVRQIQAAALREFRASQALSVLRPIEEELESIIAQHGHIMRHESVLAEFAKRAPVATNPYVIEFVLELSNKFVHHPETALTYRAWATTRGTMDVPLKVMEAFIERLKEVEKPLPHEATVRCVLDHEVAQTHCDVITDEGVVASYLSLSKEVRRNPFGEWGLVTWTEISPRGVKDKAYVVLKREAKPMHFTEITERINASGFAKRSAIPQTVHNELIKDRRFVLVGRGIYALAEWGYQAGTVADVAARVLEKHDKPMRRDAIVEEVLTKRLVKRNTVVLALQDKTRFRRTADGMYTLISDSKEHAGSASVAASRKKTRSSSKKNA